MPGNISLTAPEASLFCIPPSSLPDVVPPAPFPPSPMRPFNIPHDIYASALGPRVPLTIAAVYAVTVKALNRYNRSRGNRPWGISKTRVFFAFVLLHNIFLAVYSAWTFLGMVGVMRRSAASPWASGGLAGFADSLCRLHGAPGLGRSLFFNETTAEWQSADTAAEATALSHGRPTSTPMGRVWNEGLAYYGWIFYISKFYEVLDTFIILAKGKFSSTLQTYHHAGAMMCMWAGIRYMSPPIWMFVYVNSFIHALMYTYYTLTAFSVKVPVAVKRTLTSMQITQFLVGASYAMAHSFVTFVAPVTITSVVATPRDDRAAPPTESVLTPGAGGVLGFLRRILGGGSSTLASHAATAPDGGSASSAASMIPITRTETTLVAQPCITTQGETFAIWLNVLYLAPLTYLFVSFFVTNYLKRSHAAAKSSASPQDGASRNGGLAEKASWDAAHGVEREVYGDGEDLANGDDDDAATANGSAAGDRSLRSGKANGRAKRKA